MAVLALAAAVGLGACGGGHSSPQVANLPTTTRPVTSGGDNGGSSATTTPTTPASDPTRLVDEWAACMRAHGDPNQADPTITANKVIDITWDLSIPGGIYGTNKGGQGNSGPGQYCRSYLTAAQSELRGGQQQKLPDPAQLLKYSECMRANGIADFPDPSGGNLSFNIAAGGDLNPNNPTFQNASKLCAGKTGARGLGSATAQPGTIEVNGAGPGSPGD